MASGQQHRERTSDYERDQPVLEQLVASSAGSAQREPSDMHPEIKHKKPCSEDTSYGHWSQTWASSSTASMLTSHLMAAFPGSGPGSAGEWEEGSRRG
eukprot:956572-Rhodomonas_salina.1